MYNFVDRRLDTLDDGCRFLVWSMRAWVLTIGQGSCPARMLAPAFARWRMIGGLQPFHRLMLLFNRDSLETMSFCPLCCEQVSEHEALILSLIAQLHREGPTQTRDTLELLVAEDGIGELLAAFAQLDSALSISGFFPGLSVADTRASD
ncbi:hypothetical protein B2G71_10585 [Novosphingobium sp. PC22D]|uniref:hypothetical protein n=1 Tax=Novosphingobium sp. PC22D TaxID=1962403 RepID=UPI000BF139AE|nr:hypothetical protein [Novosphingobium sp. PC22D]PEQ12738.1 hypothetical protein B2G71_10585 [Novosphingobium sp. PC22D]